MIGQQVLYDPRMVSKSEAKSNTQFGIRDCGVKMYGMFIMKIGESTRLRITTQASKRPNTSTKLWSRNFYKVKANTEQNIYGCSKRLSKTTTNFYTTKKTSITRNTCSRNSWKMSIVTLDMLKNSDRLTPIENKGKQYNSAGKSLFDRVDNYIKKSN